MNIKNLFRVSRVVFFAILTISFGSIIGSNALADQPTIITGGGDYEVDISLLGIDFSGERSISIAYVEKAEDDTKGVAQLRHDGRKMTLDLACLLEDFVADHGFYSIVGNVRKVKGYDAGDALFPKFAAPEVGDFVIVAFRVSDDDQVPDTVTIPFLFPPVFNGITVDCNTLVSPLGPPLSIIELLFGDLDGNINLHGL